MRSVQSESPSDRNTPFDFIDQRHTTEKPGEMHRPRGIDWATHRSTCGDLDDHPSRCNGIASRKRKSTAASRDSHGLPVGLEGTVVDTSVSRRPGSDSSRFKRGSVLRTAHRNKPVNRGVNYRSSESQERAALAPRRVVCTTTSASLSSSGCDVDPEPETCQRRNRSAQQISWQRRSPNP